MTREFWRGSNPKHLVAQNFRSLLQNATCDTLLSCKSIYERYWSPRAALTASQNLRDYILLRYVMPWKGGKGYYYRDDEINSPK